jgi:hypothetical protein
MRARTAANCGLSALPSYLGERRPTWMEADTYAATTTLTPKTALPRYR